MVMTTEERLETMRRVTNMYKTGYKNGKADVYTMIAITVLILTIIVCVVIGTGIIVL